MYSYCMENIIFMGVNGPRNNERHNNSKKEIEKYMSTLKRTEVKRVREDKQKNKINKIKRDIMQTLNTLVNISGV